MASTGVQVLPVDEDSISAMAQPQCDRGDVMHNPDMGGSHGNMTTKVHPAEGAIAAEEKGAPLNKGPAEQYSGSRVSISLDRDAVEGKHGPLKNEGAASAGTQNVVTQNAGNHNAGAAGSRTDGRTEDAGNLDDDEPPRLTIKERLWQFSNNPSSGHAANIWAITIILVIGISVGAYVVETLPVFHKKDLETWDLLEFVCVMIFTVELVLRFFACPDKCAFLSYTQFMNWIDILAIVPWYIEKVIQEITGSSVPIDFFKILRLLRVFRVFRIGKYLKVMEVFIRALVRSAPALLMLVAIILICCIFFSSLMWLAEHGTYVSELGE